MKLAKTAIPITHNETIPRPILPVKTDQLTVTGKIELQSHTIHQAALKLTPMCRDNSF
jgi:hypothetical protein